MSTYTLIMQSFGCRIVNEPVNFHLLIYSLLEITRQYILFIFTTIHYIPLIIIFDLATQQIVMTMMF